MKCYLLTEMKQAQSYAGSDFNAIERTARSPSKSSVTSDKQLFHKQNFATTCKS